MNGDYSLTDDEITYQTAKNGSYDTPSFFVSGANTSGASSLKISLPTTKTKPADNPTDRFEYEWIQNDDPAAPAFDGVERYFGFTFKIISSETETPVHGGIVFAQLWQGGTDQTPYAPPIRLDLLPPAKNSNMWPNRLLIQNATTGQNTADTPLTLYQAKIEADTWHTYVLGVKPAYDGNSGHIDLWVDGHHEVNWYGEVGYKPASRGGLAGTFDSLMVKSGIYRNRPNPNATVAFGEINYADNYSEAAP